MKKCSLQSLISATRCESKTSLYDLCAVWSSLAVTMSVANNDNLQAKGFGKIRGGKKINKLMENVLLSLKFLLKSLSSICSTCQLLLMSFILLFFFILPFSSEICFNSLLGTGRRLCLAYPSFRWFPQAVAGLSLLTFSMNAVIHLLYSVLVHDEASLHFSHPASLCTTAATAVALWSCQLSTFHHNYVHSRTGRGGLCPL